MGRGASKDGDEHLAGLLLRAVLGVDVRQHDDGTSDSMYDLDVIYPDGRLSAAEAVSTRDRRALAQLAAVTKLGYVREPRLARFWWVQVSERANLKRTRAAIVPLLLHLERQGIDRVPRHGFGSLRDDLDAISVESCRSNHPTNRHPPGFYLWPGPRGAWAGDGEKIVREANDFLATVTDVAAKLRASGASERHAVVIVTVDRFEFFVAVENGHVPTTRPELPDGIDCLWLVTLKTPPLQAVYWLNDGPWAAVSLTAEQLGVTVLTT
jgi:hypothetical protein